MQYSRYDIPGSGKLIRLSLSLDPFDRARAYVGAYGDAGCFTGKGDNYQMAAEYASYLTRGAITFTRKDGTQAPVVQVWNPEQWLKENNAT